MGGLDAGCLQARQPLTRHLRIGVDGRGHHAPHPRFDQGIGTGRRAAMMGAGLEGDIGGGAAGGRAGLLQRQHLGMRATRHPVPALAHHLAVAHQHTTDARIGMGGIQPAFGQPQGTGHVTVVLGGKRRLAHSSSSISGIWLLRISGVRSFSSRSISSRKASTSSKLM